MVTRNGDGVATYAYDPEDRVVNLLRGNGVQTTNVYDAVGRMLVTAHLGPGDVPLEAVQYGYDTVGRRTYAMFGDDVGDRFAYDALDQVTGVVYDIVRPDVNLGPGSGHEQTEYDAMGNRDSFMTDVNTNVYTANGLNQYTAIDGAGLTYDLDGNLVFDNQSRTLSWDGENCLRSVAPISPTNGSVKVEMSYDDQSRRVGKTVSIRTNGVWVQQSDTVFTYQGWNLISEIRSQGSAVSTNVYIWVRDLSGSLQGAGGVGGLLCSYSTLSSSLHYFSYDGNGNVILLTDAAGAVAGRYRYEAFGALRSMTGLAAVENPFRFSTKYSDDETGLVYYGFRYYSPSMGRWINRDPRIEALRVGESSAALANLDASIASIAKVLNEFQASKYASSLTDKLRRLVLAKYDMEKLLYGGDVALLYHFTLNNPLSRVDPDGQTAIVLPVIPIVICAVAICYIITHPPPPVALPWPDPPDPPINCDVSTDCAGPCTVVPGHFPIMGTCGYRPGLGRMTGCQVCSCH